MLRIKRPMWFMAEEGQTGGNSDDMDNGAVSSGSADSDIGASGTGEVTWPENWRETYAGEDEKKLARLARYASPTAAFDGLIAAQNKISSGEYKAVVPFPAEGTEEEQNAWRTENGIPESPEKYDLSFDDGLVIGDDDKPFIDEFLKTAHAANMPPDQAKATVHWYYDNLQKQEEERAEQDAQIQQTTEDALRAEWGNDYRTNINRIHGFLDQAGEEVKESIMSARLADGTPLASHEGVLKFFIDQALQLNPALTVVPSGTGDKSAAIQDEIANIESMMGNKNSEYWKGPKAETMQERYRKLIEAQTQMKKAG